MKKRKHHDQEGRLDGGPGARTSADKPAEPDPIDTGSVDRSSLPGAAATPAEAQPTDETAELSDQIQKEMEELEDLRDRHLRLAAEFENYRKRTRRELAEGRERGQSDLAAGLLEVLDDLRRVAETQPSSTSVEALHEGIALVDRKLRKVLEESGLRFVHAAAGDRFDPAVHEALSSVAAREPEDDDLISRVFTPGYMFGDRLLRPAQVEVQKHSGVAQPESSPRDRSEGVDRDEP